MWAVGRCWELQWGVHRETGCIWQLGGGAVLSGGAEGRRGIWGEGCFGRGCARGWCPAVGALPQPPVAHRPRPQLAVLRHTRRAARRYLGVLNITESLQADIAARLSQASPVCTPGHHGQHRALHHPWDQSCTAAPLRPHPWWGDLGALLQLLAPRGPGSPARGARTCWRVHRAPLCLRGDSSGLVCPKARYIPPRNVEQRHVPGLPHDDRVPPGV